MKIFFYITFATFAAFVAFQTAGWAYAAGNTSETATTTPSIIENISPEALFDRIRGFLTIPIQYSQYIDFGPGNAQF